MKFSIQAQISEVERELALRRGVYPRLVQSKKMKQEVANYHMGRLAAVLQTLKWVEQNEERIKALLAKENTNGADDEQGDVSAEGGISERPRGEEGGVVHSMEVRET